MRPDATTATDARCKPSQLSSVPNVSQRMASEIHSTAYNPNLVQRHSCNLVPHRRPVENQRAFPGLGYRRSPANGGMEKCLRTDYACAPSSCMLGMKVGASARMFMAAPSASVHGLGFESMIARLSLRRLQPAHGPHAQQPQPPQPQTGQAMGMPFIMGGPAPL